MHVEKGFFQHRIELLHLVKGVFTSGGMCFSLNAVMIILYENHWQLYCASSCKP